jgi:hypothetical protein
LSKLPAAFIANARTMPTGASDLNSSSHRRALIALAVTNSRSINTTAHQLWTRA